MSIDYDYYTTLSDKEVEKLLIHLKNIQHLRQKDLENIFKYYDSKKLKDYLSTHDNIIPNFILENIYALTKLDTCSNNNKEAHFILTLCQTQYRSAFLGQNLFNSFFHMFGFKPDMIEFFVQHDKDLLMHYINKGFAFNASQEAIELLYEKKLIHFDNEQFQQELLEKTPENFIIFSLKNNLLALDQVSIRHIFFTQLPYYKIDNLNYLEKHLKDSLFEPSFSSLQTLLSKTYANDSFSHYKLGTEGIEEKVFYNHIKNFIKAETHNFSYMLNKIDLQENDIHIMLKAFNNTYPNNNKNFIALLEHLRDNPNNWSDALLFKEVNQDNFPTINNGGFKQLVLKSLFNFKLERQLDSDKQKKSQIKI